MRATTTTLQHAWSKLPVLLNAGKGRGHQAVPSTLFTCFAEQHAFFCLRLFRAEEENPGEEPKICMLGGGGCLAKVQGFFNRFNILRPGLDWKMRMGLLGMMEREKRGEGNCVMLKIFKWTWFEAAYVAEIEIRDRRGVDGGKTTLAGDHGCRVRYND